jgi:serine/threonine-protein kinase SMG1
MASGEGGDSAESWRNEKYFANNRGRNEKQRDKNNESRSYREFSNSGGGERRLSTYSRKPVRERYTYRYDDKGEWIGEPGKLQESAEKSQSQLDLKVRAATLQYNLPEDLRISKLLRRLCGENDPTTAIDLCEKLKLVLQDKSNAAYIHRSFDILADSIISVIEKGPRECLFHAAEAFGLMGYVVRNDFPKYKTWIVKMYKKSKSLKIYMMKALYETVKQDSNSLDLRDQSSRLMELLKDFLEAVDVPEIFLSIIDVIVVVCRNYPKNFEPYFTDIVDIVVGWHLEAEQTFDTKFHISKVLQEFKPFWEKDIKFTLNLLTLFLEDITACGDEINHKTDEEDKSRTNSPFFLDKSVLPEFCFGSFVGAFTTVLKCLYCTTPEMLVGLVGKELLEESFIKIMQVAAKAMEHNHSEEIVMPVNEYICLLIDCQKADIKIPIDDYFQLLRIELKNNQKYSTNQILSLLMVILKTVYQYKGKEF